MAPLDVVTAQSEVAAREVDVIMAENALAQAEDNLKQAISQKNDPAMWATRIVPMDRPTAEPVPVDIDAAVRNALENRTDIVAARKALEQNDISLAFAKNQLLPQLNLVANYGGAGAGGTQLIRDPPLGGPVVDTVPGGYGDALSEVFGLRLPDVDGRRQRRVLDPQPEPEGPGRPGPPHQGPGPHLLPPAGAAGGGRGAHRGERRGVGLQDGGVDARPRAYLYEQRLDAEEKKFAAGMSTNFLVTQAQRDLAQAQVAELRAIADYRESIINFQRVQEAGLSGAGAVALLTASGSQSSQAIARPPWRGHAVGDIRSNAPPIDVARGPSGPSLPLRERSSRPAQPGRPRLGLNLQRS